MRRKAFIRIFWGLIFVDLDLRIVVDLLPDFIGYILIARGLNLLYPEQLGFRKAFFVSVIMIFVSIPDFFDGDSGRFEGTFRKRQWISAVTGDLSALLPREVNSVMLLRTTSSRSAIDANRTNNPQRYEDRVLGEYSDGTVVLILRYDSSEDALWAMKQKTDIDYSREGLEKRAETDESFRGISSLKVFTGSSDLYTDGKNEMEYRNVFLHYENVEVEDRVIQQWWNTGGWGWWSRTSPYDKGSWSNRILYIVEGYRSSADTYKSAFEGTLQNRGVIYSFTPSPFHIICLIVEALLIWEICSGIIELSRSLNNYDLMNIAKGRRKFYMILTVTGLALLLLVPSFSAPTLSELAVLVIFASLSITIIAEVLILSLLRKAANINSPMMGKGWKRYLKKTSSLKPR